MAHFLRALLGIVGTELSRTPGGPGEGPRSLTGPWARSPGVGKRSKTMVFLDLKKRSVDKAAA